MKKTERKTKNRERKAVVETVDRECIDKDCPIHGNLKLRGRTFKGKVTKKFYKRVVVEFEKMIYIRKYERYAKSKTKIHARLPICMQAQINVGDYIKVQECRPLSKIIHFAVVEKIKDAEENQNDKEAKK